MGSNASQPAVYTTAAYACVNTFLVLTTIGIIARSISRHLQKASFGVDDALAYAAYTSNAVALIIENTVVAQGVMDLDRFTNFTLEDTESFSERTLAMSVMYLITMATAKLSVIFLCRRIFGMYRPWFVNLWWLNFLVIMPVWSGATLALIIWAQLKTLSYGTTATAYATAAVALVNVISDIMVLVLPVGGVLRLQLSKSRKFGIIGIFCLGLTATLISFGRLTLEFDQAVQGTFPWNAAYTNYMYAIISYAETSAATLCCCTPVARPFIAKVGEVASRNMSLSSIRFLVSKASLSSHGSRPSEESDRKEMQSKYTVSRTVAIDVNSVQLARAQSSSDSNDRAAVLGFIPRQESLSHITAGV